MSKINICMKVKQTKEKDVPSLGQKIKQARLKDDRPLTHICREIGMSTNHWYDIENESVPSIPVETLRRIETAIGVDFGVTFDD